MGKRLPYGSESSGDCAFAILGSWDLVIDTHIVSASVVIGDLDTKGAEKVVAEIVELGG